MPALRPRNLAVLNATGPRKRLFQRPPKHFERSNPIVRQLKQKKSLLAVRLHVTVNALSSLQYLPSVCFSMEPLQAQDNSDIKALFVSPSETYARDFHRIFEPPQIVRCLFQEPTTETDPSPQEIVVAVNPLPVNGVGGEDIDGNLDAQLIAPIEEQGID